MRKMMIVAAAALAVVSSAALASVTFDYGSGTGFVGKGDVQVIYGWNNKAAQTNTPGVTFSTDTNLKYEVDCEWITITGGKTPKTIYHDVTKKTSLSSSLALDAKARTTGQYTGWNLLGYIGTPPSVDLPEINASCPQGGTASDNDPVPNDAYVTAVRIIEGPTSTLFVEFNGDRRELPLTPVITTTL